MFFDQRKAHSGAQAADIRHSRLVGRRRLLKLGAVATVGALLHHPLAVKAGRLLEPSRQLNLFNTHTGETLSTEYYSDGRYSREALQAINHILRDFRTGEVKPIDIHLLDLVHTITTKVKSGAPVHIISGYRSPQTNRSLARASNGVASRSLHMDGMAMDLRIPGCDLTALHKVARAMAAGGVGYYQESNFVHIDTGRVRFW
ncbi:MAG: YcbK family protein [Desulfurivibrionaceae bacterium]|nr:YcbK family protein [Desulfurivibrionaceae bacterium]